MNSLKALLTVLLLCTAWGNCSALASEARDGTWLKQGVDSFNRLANTQAPRKADIDRSEIFLAYVEGALAVHRQNNLMASMIIHATEKSNGKEASLDPKARVALAFAPLLRVPDQMPSRQVVAILQKYLEANPGKWGASANVIVTQAFQQAFVE